jgi:hypothetical protein
LIADLGQLVGVDPEHVRIAVSAKAHGGGLLARLVTQRLPRTA